MNEVGRVEMDGYIRPGCAWMWMDGSWKKREVVAGEATTTWSEPESVGRSMLGGAVTTTSSTTAEPHEVLPFRPWMHHHLA